MLCELLYMGLILHSDALQQDLNVPQVEMVHIAGAVLSKLPRVVGHGYTNTHLEQEHLSDPAIELVPDGWSHLLSLLTAEQISVVGQLSSLQERFRVLVLIQHWL